MSENTPELPSAPTPDGAQPGGYTPQPAQVQPMLESEARTWAMLVHVIAAAAVLLSAGFLGFVVPLVLWLIYRERSALVDWHGKQNLNLQLTVLVVSVAAVVIGFATLFIGFLVTIPLWIAYGLYSLVISIIAGVRAHNGEYYKIPLIIPFLR